jgi:hypothetical protein
MSLVNLRTLIGKSMFSASKEKDRSLNPYLIIIGKSFGANSTKNYETLNLSNFSPNKIINHFLLRFFLSFPYQAGASSSLVGN